MGRGKKENDGMIEWREVEREGVKSYAQSAGQISMCDRTFNNQSSIFF